MLVYKCCFVELSQEPLEKYIIIASVLAEGTEMRGSQNAQPLPHSYGEEKNSQASLSDPKV